MKTLENMCPSGASKHGSSLRPLLLLGLLLLVGCGRAAASTPAAAPTSAATTSPSATATPAATPSPSATATPLPVMQPSLYVGLIDGSVVALNGADGSVRWHAQPPGNFVATVGALANETVYVASCDGGGTGSSTATFFSALSANDGAIRWTYKAGNAGCRGRVQHVGNGVVYAIADKFYALNANNGKLLWQQTIPDDTMVTTNLTGNGVLYLSATAYTVDTPGSLGTSYLYAFNGSDGSILWQHQAPQSSAQLQAVANGMLYVDESAGLVALNASNGSILWQQNGSFIGVDNDQVYVENTDRTTGGSSYAALAASNGAVRWRLDAPRLASNLASASGAVYLAHDDGLVLAYNAKDGSVLWQRQTATSTTPTTFTLQALHGAVYVLNQNFRLFALNGQDGAVQWQQQTVYFTQFLAVVNGVIYGGEDNDRFVAALNASDGSLYWKYVPGISITTPIVG